MNGGGVKDEVTAVELNVLWFTQRMVVNVGAHLTPQRVSRAVCRHLRGTLLLQHSHWLGLQPP